MSAIIIRQGARRRRALQCRRRVLIVAGRIAEVAATIDAPSDAHEFDARDCWVDGFVDLHAHLREPGEAAETIESGARAGRPGGLLRAGRDANQPVSTTSRCFLRARSGARTALDVAVAGDTRRSR